MQGSEASLPKVGPQSNSWPMLLPLVCSNWQDPKKVTDQRVLPILWRLNWNHFYKKSPRTVQICHSVGTTCSREAGTNSSGCKSLPKCTFNHQIFPGSGRRRRKCSPPRIWHSATAKHTRHCFHMFLFFLKVFDSSRGHYNDLRIHFLDLRPEALQWLWWEALSFLVSSVGAAPRSPWRSRIALK